jgi:hypothetical protein
MAVKREELHGHVARHEARTVKWEYRIAAFELEHPEGLNRLGADGWELVAIHQNRGYFKRPVAESEGRLEHLAPRGRRGPR